MRTKANTKAPKPYELHVESETARHVAFRTGLPFRIGLPIRIGAICMIAVALLSGHAAAQSDSGENRTVAVAPSGSDDTESLQAALDACRSAEVECVVELAEGTFLTRPLVVHDFRGTLRGAGRETTIIEAMPDIDVVDAEPAVIAVPPTVDEPWPFLISFFDGDIAVSDLTLRISEPAPTTGWRFFDTEFDAMVATLLISGTSADAVIERVGVEGADGNFTGTNLINGLYIEGIVPDPEVPWSIDSSLPLRGTFVVRDSTFTNAAYNLATTNLVDSFVLIEGNTFDASPVVDGGATDIDLLEQSNTFTIVRNNRLNGVRGMGIHLVQGDFLSDLAPSFYWVSDNQLRTRGVGQGIVVSDHLYDMNGIPTLNAVIEDNHVSLVGEAHAVFTTGSAGVHLLDNVFAGSGRAGITIGTSFGADQIARADGWTIAGNDMANLDVRGPAIVLGEGAAGTTVVCGAGVSATDEGTGNTVICGD